STHPDLIEKGTPDPAKRIAIAQFMKDVGWLDAATKEMDKARDDCKDPWPPAATERADKLRAAIDKETTKQLADEAELAVASGRYVAARKAIELFKPENADPKDVTRVSTFKSQVDGVMPRYEKAVSLLRPVVESTGKVSF